MWAGSLLAQRLMIHSSTRMLSPKPGHSQLPSGDFRNQFTWKIFGSLASSFCHVDPVLEVVADVVPAEGQHGHRVAADVAGGAGGGGGDLRAHRGADEDAVLPALALVDQRHGGGAAAAEDDGADRHAVRVLQSGSMVGHWLAGAVKRRSGARTRPAAVASSLRRASR